MSVDDSKQEAWAAMQAERGRPPPTLAEPELPLRGGGGGGTSGGMEPRVAKLEAHMEHVRAELSKLADLPADLATVKERLLHLPTKADMKVDVDGAIDRAGTRTQRTIAIASGAVTLAIAAINYLPRLFGH